MNLVKKLAIVSLAMMLSGCLASMGSGLESWNRIFGIETAEEKSPPPTRIDEVPMYGGMDRSKHPQVKKADDDLIANLTKEFGSRAQAADAAISTGFSYFKQGKLGMAMRRFNQAWLLDPEKADVYHGFASVLHSQRKYCEANDMMEKAFSKNPSIAMPSESYFALQGFYPDAARISTLCATHNKDLSLEEKKQLFARSLSLLEKGDELLPDTAKFRKAYLYSSWASVYYWQGEYEKAWVMVKKEKDAGGSPSREFLDRLNQKMPEPAQ